ncbi:hypothetical protein MCETALH18_00112 [Methylophilaceae bacterium]
MSGLSDVFKYISHFRHAGHQVGRKVGDMLEVLTYAAIARERDLLSRLHVEPKLMGFCDAGHKVEFTLLSDPAFDSKGLPQVKHGGVIDDPESIFAFIECKKVGVEQTVNTSFKKQFTKHSNSSFKVPYDEEFIISFSPRGGKKYEYVVIFKKNNSIVVKMTHEGNKEFIENFKNGHRIIFTLSKDNFSEILGNNASLRDVKYSLKNCRILEILSADDSGVEALLNDCLPGPQTPEKAKQASFVALDVRKRRFNSFDMRPNETNLISVLVLTEFAHWEQKSQNMITACIDKNFVIEDALIIEAFINFESHFGEGFYDKITKDSFETDLSVRKLAMAVVEKYQGKIFVDLEDNTKKKFQFDKGKLSFIS